MLKLKIGFFDSNNLLDYLGVFLYMHPKTYTDLNNIDEV